MKKMMAFMLGMMMLACIMTGCGGAGKVIKEKFLDLNRKAFTLA